MLSKGELCTHLVWEYWGLHRLVTVVKEDSGVDVKMYLFILLVFLSLKKGFYLSTTLLDWYSRCLFVWYVKLHWQRQNSFRRMSTLLSILRSDILQQCTKQLTPVVSPYGQRLLQKRDNQLLLQKKKAKYNWLWIPGKGSKLIQKGLNSLTLSKWFLKC